MYFYLRPVQADTNKRPNTSSSKESFWGIHHNNSFSSFDVDFYYLGLNRDNSSYFIATEDEMRHTIGVRLYKEIQNQLFWDIEAAYQFGEFGEQDIKAWTIGSEVEYFFDSESVLNPRFTLSMNIASGDSDSSDNTLGTFNPLFPNKSYFEEAALLSPQNFYNVEPGVAVNLTESLTLAIDYNMFWRLEDNDTTYIRGLSPFTETASSMKSKLTNVASLSLDYRLSNDTEIDLSYNHFSDGAIIRDIGGSDMQFIEVAISKSF